MNALIIAAHPDDEVLGCGGTMAKLSRAGNAVYTLILSEGITSRDEKRNRSRRGKEIKELKAQIEKCRRILGVKKSFVFDFPDNRFDTVALLDIIKAIENVKREVLPEIVFTHHYGDLNIDHRITFQAVMTAFRPVKGETVREMYSFEAPSSTEWNVPNNFMPNYFIDIAKTLAVKITAMKEYKGEIREFPHPRSPEALETIAKKWGIQIGSEAVEAFEAVRIIR